MRLTASAIAGQFGLTVLGDGSTEVSGVATLAHAGAGQLSFLSNPRYRPQLADSQAAVVVLRADDAEAAKGTALVAKDPYTAFAKIAALFDVAPVCEPGIHPSAVIDPTAQVSPGAHVGPFVSIGARSRVGDGCVIGTGSLIGADCVVDDGSELLARVTLVTRVRLGKRVRIHPGAVIGADGFGLAMDAGHWIKVPQLGGVVIGDDCEIGANTCIDRGALEDTVLEEDVRVDNLVQIAHNCRIGAHSAIAGCSGIAGSAKIGRYCLLGGHVGVVGHLEICDKVVITGKSVVRNSINEPGEYSSGTPLTDNRTWRKNAARFKQLDVLARRILAVGKEKRMSHPAYELPIDVNQIQALIPHRYPFLLIDRVIELDLEAKRIVGQKNVSINEPFFQGHFPTRPVMPGVLIIEALAQAGGVMTQLGLGRDALSKLFYMVKVDNARFNKQVVPGDVLILEVQMKRLIRNMGCYYGEAKVNGEIVASAEIMCAAARE
ncbi:UDP-3-O-(3-hydroxymyristoyl)glucosamine N-acyltransferase [Xanthomonas oryzae pv. oryzae]|nr:UDP-3-O-(3-hydroxymyristoyl)glucosamine N-acyltransferase [Xanthomonas oryzae pv. oryzae]